jgi:hypothetical protein
MLNSFSFFYLLDHPEYQVNGVVNATCFQRRNSIQFRVNGENFDPSYLRINRHKIYFTTFCTFWGSIKFPWGLCLSMVSKLNFFTLLLQKSIYVTITSKAS